MHGLRLHGVHVQSYVVKAWSARVNDVLCRWSIVVVVVVAVVAIGME